MPSDEDSLCLRATHAKPLIREILRTGSVVFSSHALTEMAADHLEQIDVMNILRGGIVEEPELENGSWRYRVRTQRMAVVVALRSQVELVVVTAWRTTR